MGGVKRGGGGDKGASHSPKLVLRPVYTGDFCRATQWNFYRVEVAGSQRGCCRSPDALKFLLWSPEHCRFAV